MGKIHIYKTRRPDGFNWRLHRQLSQSLSWSCWSYLYQMEICQFKPDWYNASENWLAYKLKTILATGTTGSGRKPLKCMCLLGSNRKSRRSGVALLSWRDQLWYWSWCGYLSRLSSIILTAKARAYKARYILWRDQHLVLVLVWLTTFYAFLPLYRRWRQGHMKQGITYRSYNLLWIVSSFWSCSISLEIWYSCRCGWAGNKIQVKFHERGRNKGERRETAREYSCK